MKRTKWNPRKVLIASAGVASVNYAVVVGCNDGDGAGIVANLVVCPPSQCSSGGTGNGGFAGASVANLVAPPAEPPADLPPNVPDASAPDASPDDAGAGDAGARDAAPDGAA